MKSRNLILLALVTGLFAVAALVAVMMKQTSNLAEFDQQPLFPGLSGRIEAISKIKVETPLESITATRDAKGAWTLPGSGGWAANFDTVRKTALALSGLKTSQRRTANKANHAVLSLLAPDISSTSASLGGKGFRITAYDAADAVLASIIIGKVSTPPDGAKPGIAYVRRADEDQSYLAEGEVNFPLQVSDWIDRILFDIAAARVMSVSVTPPNGPAYEVRRAEPKATFAILDIPKGKEPTLDDLAQRIAEAVVLLPLDDAARAEGIDFTGAAKVVHRMFDGLVLSSMTVMADNRRMTRFEASFDAAQAALAAKAGLIAANPDLKSATDAQQQIAGINARTSGWAFLLPGMKGADLMRDHASLFRAKRPPQSEPVAPPTEPVGE